MWQNPYNIFVSLLDYFKKIRKDEGAGQERLKIIHNETKGKVALIGVGGLRNENDINKALDSGFSEFIAGDVPVWLIKILENFWKKIEEMKFLKRLTLIYLKNIVCLNLCEKWVFKGLIFSLRLKEKKSRGWMMYKY